MPEEIQNWINIKELITMKKVISNKDTNNRTE